MGATTTPTADQAKALVDQIIDQQQVLAAAQAKHAELMLAFSDTRRRLDHTRINTLRGEGADPRYTAGEFAALEIGLAIKANKHSVSRTIGIARRVQAETPDAWDAWQAGHIDHHRAARINKTLIRLTRDSSKQLLNALVVEVATRTTVEILGRWRGEFVARVEPDQTNDRLRRSLDDRYVSIRPDIDGISFLNAAIASADADAINQVLDALAAIAEPGDTRTFTQRRADACTELLLGKISNGCHVSWQDDVDDEDDEDEDEEDDEADPDGVGDEPRDDDNNPGTGAEEHDDDEADADADRYGDARTEAEERHGDARTGAKEQDGGPVIGAKEQDGGPGTGAEEQDDDDPDIEYIDTRDVVHPADPATCGADPTSTGSYDEEPADDEVPAGNENNGDGNNDDDRPWDTDADWDLPASAFRPDPHAPPPDHPDPEPPDDAGPPDKPPTGAGPQPNRNGRPVITPCPHDHHTRPIPATIGVIITAQSLLGYSNTPGQLTDRSTLIPADLIRDLARQPGTLFHRLLTDEQGNLLDVTELGRFPSRKLGTAIDYRDGTCSTPICTTPAHKCDHDHVIPVPEGPTTAINLQNHCRPEHRAKTHAGHHNSRDGHTSTWTTPTGHTYTTTTDQPFPVEQWPSEQGPAEQGPANKDRPNKDRPNKDRANKDRANSKPGQRKRNDADRIAPGDRLSLAVSPGETTVPRNDRPGEGSSSFPRETGQPP